MGTTRKSLAIFWRVNMRWPGLFWGTAFLFSAGLIASRIVLPLIAAHTINKLVELNGQPHANYWDVFVPILITFGVVMVIARTITEGAFVLLSKLETKARPALQNRIFDMFMNQSMAFHANNFSGALVNQTNKFTGSYISLTDLLLINVLEFLVSIVVAIGVITFFTPVIGVAMLCWTIFFVWINMMLTKRRMYLSRIATKADSALTAHLADAVGNVSAIKAFGREEHEKQTHSIKAYDRANKKYISWIRATKNGFVFGLLIGFLQLTILGLSVWSVMEGKIDIGVFLLVQVYLTQIITLLWGLSGITRNIEQAVSDASEMTEILEEPLGVEDPRHPKPLTISKGAIGFNDITFAHDGNEDTLFSGFTLRVAAGEKIGLVGHSGSGKTSLTRLLLRFIDVDAGSITIDGQDIRKVAQADLRRYIAYVPQEPVLFHRSLRDNIAYGRPDATDEEVARAARLAHAEEFIHKLPKGYSTMVGERGVKLSGGQRQRIAIARAILKDAPILLLDEATSALDSESEKLIQDALKKLMKGRTTIVIAHRLSTIQKMDRIVVLHEGRIIEQGSHDELLKKDGTYADLWKHQSGGFIEE
ncbi:MAG TPA: ABC transporter ATP-binding protein [Candidatus Saccharimonadales bacterium]|nr:ABC transporter ATP-binding protein [Candidatus Saccharimonadales bacterium]